MFILNKTILQSNKHIIIITYVYDIFIYCKNNFFLQLRINVHFYLLRYTTIVCTEQTLGIIYIFLISF